MKSYQFEEYGQPLVENTKEAPAVSGKQVLMKISACGVCHSDIHIWEGHFDLGGGKHLDVKGKRPLPFTLGHEIVGEVVAVGDDVSGVNIGDKRVVYPWIGCDECHICEAGNGHLCNRPQALGIDVDGGYSDHLVVPDAKYLLDYEGIDKESACTYTCSGLTAYSALKKVKSRTDNGSLLIIGCGGVGMAGLAIARSVTNAKIYVADIDPEKRQMGLDAGADAAFDPNDRDQFKELMRLTNGGVNGAIDFVGAESSAKFGSSVLAKGGKLVIVGLFGGGFSMPLPMFPIKAIAIEGTFVGSLEEMHELMDLAKQGKLQTLNLDHRPMCEADQALNDLREGKVMGRVVLKN
ncbi:alcohol dehydrogenase catalytic domain-containing protein [Sneathiella sp. P13V-1]|uniref:alcohol dehydrogenase n=1 Tax=Sneathiella sp. P13V-1 TaxID=2697366 RepID=UPI00187B7D3C|nr:alcohol dehydrogenase [Sneathiella sp. P13V-1]MBE7637387.1 alcohol dehydrogenase catalytic domain-containing protein [Sneathiella sp. P13V-1]